VFLGLKAVVQKKSAKFHPDPIWNNGAWGFFEERYSNNKKNKIFSSLDGLPVAFDVVFTLHIVYA